MNNLQMWSNRLERMSGSIDFKHGYLSALKRVHAISLREYRKLILVHGNPDNVDNRWKIENGSLIDGEDKNE